MLKLSMSNSNNKTQQNSRSEFIRTWACVWCEICPISHNLLSRVLCSTKTSIPLEKLKCREEFRNVI